MDNATATQPRLHPAVAGGIAGIFILNLAFLMSLPPVLTQRGAPYLPTFKDKMNKMFDPLRSHFSAKKTNLLKDEKQKLLFVDLGSGDGRVVFRAAREKIFHKAIGYEINPFLHVFAQTRRYIQAPLYLSATNFYMKDLWKADLSKADAVAVYGLYPMMTELGVKLKKELRPGSIVMSNVFVIPGWTPSHLSRDGMHIYIIPECFRQQRK
eukprot:CAMPEP_0178922622 /NCGR_PEP_ID=MMETSP0786-20121207/16259_1 /TAXON_ID=186022 /ORGANISM="Thalassionema frauenfeldii, Strain CCMP 1798" /LENGTH=209 /DNA_ID=CAMNT_0020597013 /DNA_START=98 /DNA_END=727 /DNA_ORIENTATION=+